MTERDHDEPEELAAAGALGALDADERARLAAARAADAELDRSAAGYEDAAAALGAAVEPVAPPPAMRDALMARIARTPQAAPAAATTADAPDAPEAVAAPAAPQVDASAESVEPPHAPGPAERRARDRWGIRAVTAVASVAAAGALLVAGIALGGGFSGSAVSPESVVAEISAAPDAQRQSVPLADGATATLVWSDELDRTALLVDELPALGGDQTYEAWVITEAGIAAAGLFDAGADGVTVHLIDGAPAGATIGVTVEPAGGSDQPTTDPIIAIPTA
ncbi:anti-sigma factor [Agromyces sp. SYSU T00194]|uniref:anti-sigma factor n=1 Tax=Agromyces chitinivorans TaxID=3158560 RepID=UPI003390964F